MFNAVKNDLPNQDAFYQKFMNVFMVNGFDPFYAGSTRTLYGGIVGIPKTFTYKSIKDALDEAKDIRVKILHLLLYFLLFLLNFFDRMEIDSISRQSHT